MIIFILLSFILSIYYCTRIINEPIHPDSGEFIYPGMMQRLGFQKIHLQKYQNGNYQPASLSYNAFPPAPHCTISDKQKYIGAFPYFRDKMFVWWFFEKLYALFLIEATSFRRFNTFLIFIISQLFFIVISEYQPLHFSIYWSLVFQMTIMLPHFDFYQIHAEEWGTLLLIILLILLSLATNSFISPILFGIILVVIFFFIKITFALTLFYFFLSPLIIFHNISFFKLSFISLMTSALALFIYFIASGLLKPVLWSINPFHLLKYKKSAATSRDIDQRKGDFSIKYFISSYFIELIIGILAISLTFFWIFSNSIQTPFEVFVFGWICVGCLEIVLQGKFYPSHFLPLTLPGMLFIALQSNIYAILISLLVLFLWTRFFCFSSDPLLFKYGRQSQNPYIDLISNYNMVAKTIMQNSSEKDSILVVGYASPLYVISRRKAALGLYEALTTIEPFDLSKKLGRYWEWWLLLAILQEKPTLIIDANNMLNIKELASALDIELQLISNIDPFHVYEVDYNSMVLHPRTLGETIFNCKPGVS